MVWRRVVVLLAVLAVPLALALASQNLAARPGAPAVPAEAVNLPGLGSAPAPVAGRSATPSTAVVPTAPPRSSTAAAPPETAVPSRTAAPGSPRLVAPGVERGDDADDDVEEPDDD